MRRTIGAVAGAMAMIWASAASAATWVVDLDTYELGSTINFNDLTPPYVSLYGIGTVVQDPRGEGRAVRIDPQAPGRRLVSGHTGRWCEPTFPCWLYQADMTADLYAPTGGNLVFSSYTSTLSPGHLQSIRFGSGIQVMYEAIYLTNLQITDGWSPTPEPETWAMMIIGFGMAGAALRRPGLRRGTFQVDDRNA
ncbi:MAG: PEPxxWA-CTERM sorting domain-containing protein [Pseudomonadota bacterium]